MKNPIRFNIQLTEEQKNVKNIVLNTPVNFIVGKEGTGKTMLAVNIALDLFFRKDTHYKQIIITRPTVTTEDFGFLPGGISEKLDPFLQPIYENLRKVYGATDAQKNKIAKHLEKGDIRILPIAFTRGVSYDNAVVIVDEFQNCTKSQIEMIIGRLGKTSKLIFSGSKQQIDLKYKSDSCIKLLDRLKSNQYCHISELITNHRHPSIESILNSLRNEN
jgi:phosphate starvation-inducible protein PhoH